jgi:hypothetical protein
MILLLVIKILGRYRPNRIGIVGGVNPYVYAYDNPLRFIDRLGLAPENYGGTPGLGGRENNPHGLRSPVPIRIPVDPESALENRIGRILVWCARKATWVYIVSPTDTGGCDDNGQCADSPDRRPNINPSSSPRN